MIGFDFRDAHYDAIIRIRQKPAGREFHITVLDWELERLLYGNHIIKEEDGSLQANLLPEKKIQTELKLTIAGALSQQLKIGCFADDICVTTVHSENRWEDWHPIARHQHQNPQALIREEKAAD